MAELADKADLFTVDGLKGFSFLRASFVKHRFKRHSHGEYVLATIGLGAKSYYLRGEQRLAPPGDLVLVNPDEVHDGCAAEVSGYAYVAAYFDEATLAELLRAYGLKGGAHYFALPQIRDRGLAARFLACINALYPNPEPLPQAQDEFLDSLAELFGRYGGLEELPHRQGTDLPGVALAKDFLREQHRRNPSLDEMAAACGFSKYHLLRQFKLATGLTPHAWAMQLRLESARASLLRGSSVADIAAALGFSDQSHLTRAFRSNYGVTPGIFQKKLAL